MTGELAASWAAFDNQVRNVAYDRTQVMMGYYAGAHFVMRWLYDLVQYAGNDQADQDRLDDLYDELVAFEGVMGNRFPKLPPQA